MYESWDIPCSANGIFKRRGERSSSNHHCDNFATQVLSLRTDTTLHYLPHTYLTYCNRLNKDISQTNRFMAPYLHTYILYIHTYRTYIQYIHTCMHTFCTYTHTYMHTNIHTHIPYVLLISQQVRGFQCFHSN